MTIGPSACNVRHSGIAHVLNGNLIIMMIIIISLFRTKVQQHNYVIHTAKQCACAYLCVSVLVT